MKINRIVKLKLVDARLYFVSLIVGLLTGLVAVPYHYLLQLFFNMRKNFFQSSPPWYYHIVLFLALWGILCFVARMARRGLTSEAEAFRRHGALSMDASSMHIPFANCWLSLRVVC